MKNLVLYWLLVHLALPASAQNLVPNPGFEDYITCPDGPGEIHCPLNALPQSKLTATHWWSAVQNSPNYYNACSRNIYSGTPANIYGYHPAQSGKAYAGLQLLGGDSATTTHSDFYTQYIVSDLISTLVAGETYQVSCWVKLVFNNSQDDVSNLVALRSVDVVFTDTLLTSGYFPIPLPEHHTQLFSLQEYIDDTSQWTKITGHYVADGTEKYITLGLFDNGSLPQYAQLPRGTSQTGKMYSAYYLVDDVSLFHHGTCDTTINRSDTTVCTEEFPLIVNASSTVGNNTYIWSTGSRGSQINVTQPGKYWCRTTKDDCNIIIDSFTITGKNCGCLYIPNAFTPNNDGLNDYFKLMLYCGVENFTIRIYNRYGEEVYLSQDPHKGWNGLHGASLTDVGTYFYYLEYTVAATGQRKSMKGDLMLIR